MSIRRRVSAFVPAVVAALLACLLATPVMVCGRGVPVSAAAAAAAAEDANCACPHAEDGQCPMHKHRPRGSSPGRTSPDAATPAGTSSDGPRWCAGCRDQVDLMLATWIAFAAPLVERARPVSPEGLSALVSPIQPRLLGLADPPVSPPPRVQLFA